MRRCAIPFESCGESKLRGGRDWEEERASSAATRVSLVRHPQVDPLLDLQGELVGVHDLGSVSCGPPSVVDGLDGDGDEEAEGAVVGGGES